MFDELKKLSIMCDELKQELAHGERCRNEMSNAIEVLELKVNVLEEENGMLKEENLKIANFSKGLEWDIENICIYLEKQQDNE